MKMFILGLFTMLRCWGWPVCLSVGTCVRVSAQSTSGATATASTVVASAHLLTVVKGEMVSQPSVRPAVRAVCSAVPGWAHLHGQGVKGPAAAEKVVALRAVFTV